MFSGSVIFAESPFTTIQMLWINLIMDTFAALALATESPTDKQILRSPISRSEPIVDAVMWRDIFGQSIYQIFMILTILSFG